MGFGHSAPNLPSLWWVKDDSLQLLNDNLCRFEIILVKIVSTSVGVSIDN